MNVDQNRGITLIALVISIVVLVILAGVSVNLLFGNDGIIAKAKEGADDYLAAEQAEQGLLSELENTMNSLISSGARLPDLPEETVTTRAMITKWNITSGDQIEIIVYHAYDYDGNPVENNTNFSINWGDGVQETITSSNMLYSHGNGYIRHTYSSTNSGMLITIDGICKGFGLYSTDKLTEIVQWGATGLNNIYIGVYGNETLTTIAVPTKNSFKDMKAFNGTFSGCTALTTIPENLFANCPNVIDFQNAFSACSNLTTIPENLFANCPNITSFANTFYGCANLATVPETLFANCSKVDSFEFTFAYCYNLTTIPEDLFASSVNATNFFATFNCCSGLTTIPANLFANCPNVTNFYNTFRECTNLTGNAPDLWSRVPNGESNGYNGTPTGDGCFYNCTGLSNYSQIPNYWKRDNSPV